MMLTLPRIRRKIGHIYRERILQGCQRLAWGRPGLDIKRIGSFESYRRYQEETKGVHEERAKLERELAPAGGEDEPFSLEGYCGICQRWTWFSVNYQYALKDGNRLVPNWREQMVCPSCSFNGRLRASLQIFRDVLRPRYDAAIYMAERVTDFFRWIAARYPNCIGSEFLADGTPRGATNASGVRCEDLTHLTFPSRHFDHIVNLEVLEHVPDYRASLRECARVLKPDGTMLLSTPFHTGEWTTTRARIAGDGSIEHLLPPEYHGDPIGSGKCLCFYHFGWDLLDDLKEAGFREAWAAVFYSRDLGYMGSEQIQFVAVK